MTLEFLDHTADIAVRIVAADAPTFFQEALRGLHLILLDERSFEGIREAEELPLDLRAPDNETLLVDFFNELIYLFDTRRWISRRLAVETVTLDGSPRLRGTLRGEHFDPSRHSLQTEIKAATFHDLEVRREGGEISADVVFDL